MIVCARSLLAFVNLSLLLLKMDVLNLKKNSTQVIIAKIILYPPTELET